MTLRMSLQFKSETRHKATNSTTSIDPASRSPLATNGTHSLRRTKVALLWKTGNLRACQLLLGHTKLESTVRYLGVDVDDALELSEALEL
jgi:integrase